MTPTRELPTLALRLLGVMPPFPFSFKKPGPCHKARFMAFCLYCLKMLLLIRQLNMDEVTQEGLVRLGIFFAIIYIPHFLKASVGADAAFNDISLYKQLVSFIDMDGRVILIFTLFTIKLWACSQIVPLVMLFPKQF